MKHKVKGEAGEGEGGEGEGGEGKKPSKNSLENRAKMKPSPAIAHK